MANKPKMCFLCINYKSSNSPNEVDEDHLNCLKSSTIYEIVSSLKSLNRSLDSSLNSLNIKNEFLDKQLEEHAQKNHEQSGGKNIKKFTLKKVGSKKVGSKKVGSKKVGSKKVLKI